MSDLVVAITTGDLDAVKAILKVNKDAARWDDDALIAAVREKHVKIAQFLLQRGANVRANKDEAIVIAYKNDHVAMMRLLIFHGAIVDRAINIACNENSKHVDLLLTGKFEQVPSDLLVYAIKKQNINLVKQLLNDGANPNAGLIPACARGNYEIVTLLIGRGAEYNRCPQSMEYACARGNVELVKLLVDHGASIRYRGDLPLMYACRDGHLELFDYLITNGASISTEDYICVNFACTNNQREIILRLIKIISNRGVRPGSDPEQRILSWAIKNKDQDIAILLLAIRKVPITPPDIRKVIENGLDRVFYLLCAMRVPDENLLLFEEKDAEMEEIAIECGYQCTLRGRQRLASSGFWRHQFETESELVEAREEFVNLITTEVGDPSAAKIFLDVWNGV